MRSDSELQHDIQEELANDADINVELLDVQVYKGAATLTGKVAKEREKWKADDALRQNPDVTLLVNDLQVVGRHVATVTTPTASQAGR